MLLNHAAWAQLPEGVVASYFRALRERGRDNAIIVLRKLGL